MITFWLGGGLASSRSSASPTRARYVQVEIMVGTGALVVAQVLGADAGLGRELVGVEPQARRRLWSPLGSRICGGTWLIMVLLGMGRKSVRTRLVSWHESDEDISPLASAQVEGSRAGWQDRAAGTVLPPPP